jgi:D-alanine-D-alanine ligase
MRSGASALQALKELNYHVKDIVITKKGDWLDSGFVKPPHVALEGIDRVFIALHGEYGEDGALQRILSQHRIPFTGSNALTSSIAFNKLLTKDMLRRHGIQTPAYQRVTQDDLARLDVVVPELNRVLGEELFIKPLNSGSSLGATYAPTPDTLRSGLEQLLKTYPAVLVEEYIRGREATVAVLDHFRGQEQYVLPVIEIVPPADDPIFSYENKYNGRTQEICPGRFSYHEKAVLEEAARRIHEVLRCSHYSRSDFIVRDGQVYFLETNTLPGLTNQSLLPKAAAAVGVSYGALIEHILGLADY